MHRRSSTSSMFASTCRAVALLIPALLAIGSSLASAADNVWVGNDSFNTGNFSFSGNWQNNTLPTWSSSNRLVFSQNQNPNVTGLVYNLTGGWSPVDDILWDTNFPVARTLSSSSGEGIDFNVRLENRSSFTQTVTMNTSGGKFGASNIQLNPVTGSLILSGTIYNDNSVDYFVYGSDTAAVTNLAINTPLGPNATQSNVDFTVAGGRNSAIQVNASQVWAGTTTVESGSFIAANGVTLASTAFLVAGGTVATTSANTLADTATLTVNSGRLSIGGSDTVASLAGSGGTVDLAAGATLSAGNAGSTSYAGSLTGSGGFTKVGSGTFTLSSASSYTGATTVSAGRLSLTAAHMLADLSAVTGSAGAVLALGGNETIGSLAGSLDVALGSSTLTTGGNGQSTTYSGGISGSGGLTKSGSGTLTVTGSNGFTGGAALNAGTLGLGSANALGSSGTISFGGGTLQYSASNTIDYSGRFSNAASQQYSIDTNGQNVTLGSNLTSSGGSFTKLGSGTLTLAGGNTYDGGTTVIAGRLVGTTSTSLPGNIVNNAEVEFVTSGGNYSYSGAMSGTGTLIKSGDDELVLDGANNYSGGTIVAAGTLFGTPGSLQGPIANGGVVAFATEGSGAYSGVISGTGSLEVRGGDIAFTGTNVYTGATTVSGGGRLSVNGAFGNTAVSVQGGGALGGSGSIGGAVVVDGQGTLSPGNSVASLAVGATTFTGTSEFVGGSTFEYEYDSSAAPSVGADLLVVSGNLTIGSGADLTLADLAGSPTLFADSSTIFALVNYSGTWNNELFTYNGTALADGSRFFVGSQEWEIDYNRTSSTGLANFTGDYLTGGSFVAITAVPEPATWAMAFAGLAAGGLVMLFRQYRNHPTSSSRDHHA